MLKEIKERMQSVNQEEGMMKKTKYLWKKYQKEFVKIKNKITEIRFWTMALSADLRCWEKI